MLLSSGLSFSSDDNYEKATIKTNLDTLVNEFTDNYIMGNVGEEDYDEFLQTMEEFGLERILEIYQQTYDRYMAR